MDKFVSLRSNPFPNVLGCVDGTQIPIIAPTIDPTSYFNRKGTFSINMQVSQVLMSIIVLYLINDFFSGYM